VRRAAWLLLVSVTAAGVLLLFVFPGRTLLTQNREIAVVTQRINALDRENAALRQREAQLDDPAQIEQLARERFGLVLPGQQAFAITATAVPARAKPVVHKKRAHHWWKFLDLWS
jgi:cell division protein FtsB